MEISFFQADNADYSRVRDFYYDLIDRMQELEYHPKWHKGIYPDDAFLESSVRNGEMFLAADGERLVGAMIFNFTANEGYEGAPWSIEAKPGEYASLHALGVMPDMTRRGIGRLLVDNAIRFCAEAGCRTIRLDVLKGNLPAEKLYLSAGFTFVKRVELYYEDTGFCEFDLYEYILDADKR